ncbi:MAG: hypothetical protein JWM12_2437 [Ilumatobacteraceae bacterium]|nr:hypothetical protein [Ilumatobacteraceae bacterium]
MSFLDKAKAKAAELAGTVKDKVDDFKEGRKVEDLLQDLGRITYRRHTERSEPGDAEAIDQLVAELKKLEAEGVVVLAPVEPEPEPAVEPAADAEPTFAAPAGDGTSMPMPPPPPPAV